MDFDDWTWCVLDEPKARFVVGAMAAVLEDIGNVFVDVN